MNSKESNETSGSSSSLIPIVSHSPCDNTSTEKKSHYADNLAFAYEDETLLDNNPKKVYLPLSQSTEDELDSSGLTTENTPPSNWLFWRAAVSGCIITAVIISMYFWVHIQYINPYLVETFKLIPPSTEMPKLNFEKLAKPIKSKWLVDYDLPDGIPLIKLKAKEMGDLNLDCLTQKFALALHLESNSDLAKNWLQACGHNVAYFRADGNPDPNDVENLIDYLHYAEFLPLKASLRVEKGENILDNANFQKTRTSDEIIKSVEISGFVTAKTIQELADVLPYVEELTIKGADICTSLRRSLKTSEQACQISWPVLQKLHIMETQECRGMYDLIYSCWDMPSIEILQVRKSIISSPNANYIKGILDLHRIMKVDFADNVCFDDTLQNYPFMCQASV